MLAASTHDPTYGLSCKYAGTLLASSLRLRPTGAAMASASGLDEPAPLGGTNRMSQGGGLTGSIGVKRLSMLPVRSS